MPPEFGATIGFTKARLTDLSEELFTWHTELSFDPMRIEFSGGIAQNANALLPIAPYPARRDLLVATASGNYTALFDSYINGGDPWENTAAYAARRKRDRFTPEMLRTYCLSLGIDAFEPAYYTGPACLIERTNL